MKEISEEAKARYFEEVGICLTRGGFQVGPVEEGFMPVTWRDAPLCRVNGVGGVRYRSEAVRDPDAEAALYRALETVNSTVEYMRILEDAPTLKADGLDESYKCLNEFNDVVLAAHHSPGRGWDFVTWCRDYSGEGVTQGHYVGGDYAGAKTELGKYSGKYALSEILICGECGSPYRRQTYMPKGEKIYVWRCLNRMENGKRICKNSPTFREEVLHTAIVAAMNEMFSQQAARDVLRESVATVLASTQPKMSLPAVKSKLAALEARYKELLNLVMADSAKYEDFEDEFRTTNEEMASLRSLQTKLELEQPSTTDLDRRMEQITSTIFRVFFTG